VPDIKRTENRKHLSFYYHNTLKTYPHFRSLPISISSSLCGCYESRFCACKQWRLYPPAGTEGHTTPGYSDWCVW